MEAKDCDSIEVTYSKDLKIHKIHEALLNIFDHYTPDTIKDEIEELGEGNQRRLDFLQNLLDTLGQRQEYLNKAKIILEVYKKFSKPNKSIDIYNLGKKLEESPETVEKRLQIIEEYLDLASNFILIRRIKSQKMSKCPACQAPPEKAEESNGTSICECGYQVSLYASLSSSSSLLPKTNYDDRNNFIRGMKRVQGKSVGKLPDSLLEALDKYFEKKEGPSRTKMKDVPLNEYGEKPDTSMEIMKCALKETGYSSLYNEIPFINHIYWNWTLMDFGDLEDQMLKLYDETQIEYENIPDKERLASLTMNFRIYAQLITLRYPARRQRFLLQDSEKSLNLHQKYWKIMIEKAGYTYIPIPI